ncbi:MAG: hypothetical protein JXA89_03650 [Anaerolineae bacterium]|nr:hypothetical protein [Anaerolineae bacterium]
MVKVILNEMAARYARSLEKLCGIQSTVKDVHPLLRQSFPVALVENDQFFVFDVDPSRRQYIPIKQAPVPMPVPAGVRAAFPLDCYDDRSACVVTGDVFDSLAGYATILHEFVHCYQWQTCEPRLKQTLTIARKAQAANDYMWEINYPFPYTDPGFVKAYRSFLNATHVEMHGMVLERRAALKQCLDEGDREYLTWQEWKEGFARWIENQIRVRLGVEENHGGQQEPFDRVVFYEGGARLIAFLGRDDPGLVLDIERLFLRMLSER